VLSSPAAAACSYSTASAAQGGGLSRARAAVGPRAPELLCVVCLDAPREARLTACGHFVLCVACAGQLERRKGRCPLCRRPIPPNGW
jgi:hypothetical protein